MLADDPARSQRLDAEFAKLDALEGDEENQVVLTKLRGLITLNENLKQQEQQFRAGCKVDMDEYTEKINALKGEGAEIIDDARAKVCGCWLVGWLADFPG